ncbi:hypothetical protein [Bifidobacterium sp. SO1]|uniref:hypothetical protein n=1 Tax=Bifidobacterium sp. SO1 TaxID=2809029 RepID=UPI001BDC2A21|nr:hypothetical protein [Bifidobacterium sp. SO1]MBT1160280.1 hypothetical protein [Bifidobacterium sp. SO1]
MEQFIADHIEHLSTAATVLPIIVIVLFVLSVVLQFRLTRTGDTRFWLIPPIGWISLGVAWAIGWNLFVLVMSGAPWDAVGPMVVMGIVSGMIRYSIPGLILLGIGWYRHDKASRRKETHMAVQDL